MRAQANYSMNIELNPLDFEPAIVALENVLGLARPRIDRMERLILYAAAIEKADLSRIAGSLSTDRLGTATILLRRREEALLAGWDGVEELTPALYELARIESEVRAATGVDLDTEADRLLRILDGLSRCLSLPLALSYIGVPEHLPSLWLRLVGVAGGSSIKIENDPASARNVGLVTFQSELDSIPGSIQADDSLAVTRASTRHGAAQAIAALIAMADADQRASTTVVCDEADLLSMVDDNLVRHGLPRLGAPSHGKRTALDGLLPLVLTMCWEPLDPNLLLEFCILPGGPLGHRAPRPALEWRTRPS